MKIRSFVITARVKNCDLSMQYSPVSSMVRDYFTKVLQGNLFHELRASRMNIDENSLDFDLKWDRDITDSIPLECVRKKLHLYGWLSFLGFEAKFLWHITMQLAKVRRICIFYHNLIWIYSWYINKYIDLKLLVTLMTLSMDFCTLSGHILKNKMRISNWTFSGVLNWKRMAKRVKIEIIEGY